MNKKYEVLKTFRDKKTGQIILAGSFFHTDDKKRLKEMFERELLVHEEIKEPSKKVNISKKSGE